jgi:hypothetical protein
MLRPARPSPSSPLKNDGCVVAWMRRQNERSKNARFASRGEPSSTLGEVEKRHDGVFQQAVRQ